MAAGYDVEVSGVWFDAEAAAQDEAMMGQIKFSPALDFRNRAPLRRMATRLQARWARRRYRKEGDFSPLLLGYGVRELRDRALRHLADLTIVHSEAGLWVARELLERGQRVGIDFEDWFSRDLPFAAQVERPVRALEELERMVAQGARYILAPSRAMSQALADAYFLSPPTVVYNAQPWAERLTLDRQRIDRQEADIPSLHWFSQTIGPDRGLEMLFAALPLLKKPAQLYLRGNCPAETQRWIHQQLTPEIRPAVTILPLVPAAELPSRIAEHDIGLALEAREISSRDLSVTNKVFHYLQAGLAVVATDTQGQREVLSQCGEAGTLLSEATPRELARALDRLLSQPGLLEQAKKDALTAASGPFSWERHEHEIAAEAEKALSLSPQGFHHPAYVI